ncbi:ribokinase [Brevibacillus composti]|uniref:Ribokinase n=1 Tax=Brevibacillus composti TaxID=2796470 RepID=A0A7T5EMK5_9BACL|nr:ribokinase [Brevibacillus composti]QQE75414.1 ribokinase [Brevibacillus composti]QUO42440.1 ribokinase [Brevibacillus composti]
MKIAVLGSLNMDLVAHVHHLPQPGETIISSRFQTIPGGKGANQAVAAARLGAKVRMIGKVGGDSYGEQLLEGLAEAGIDTEGIEREGTTGMALINVSDQGENQIVLVPGANNEVTVAYTAHHHDILTDCDVLLVQLEIPLDTVAYAVQTAHRLGKRIILNPAPAQPLPEEMLRCIDTLTPNETELELLTGMPVKTLPEIEAAAQKLLAKGPGRVIVTLGEKGALLARTDGTLHIPACQVAAIDTTAAGDAFTAAFAVAQSRGMADEEAIRFASKAAAIVVTRHGAQPSLPTLEEVEAFA